ncbi:MAG: YigZ family protein [Xanthomonadales bacterium]|nr:YigZ family protein [Xanthomonadales bacterium]
MRTIAGPATCEFEIRRSRFVARAARVDALPDTLAFHAAASDPGATHNCWAWKLDRHYRSNDDGEPSGTAGRPILAAIEGKELDHVMVVVTRYFGGIKLGAGGLVRAYSTAAARYAALEACHAEKLGESYPDGGVHVRARIVASAFDDLARTLRDATCGAARLTKLS